MYRYMGKFLFERCFFTGFKRNCCSLTTLIASDNHKLLYCGQLFKLLPKYRYFQLYFVGLIESIKRLSLQEHSSRITSPIFCIFPTVQPSFHMPIGKLIKRLWTNTWRKIIDKPSDILGKKWINKLGWKSWNNHKTRTIIWLLMLIKEHIGFSNYSN